MERQEMMIALAKEGNENQAISHLFLLFLATPELMSFRKVLDNKAKETLLFITIC